MEIFVHMYVYIHMYKCYEVYAVCIHIYVHIYTQIVYEIFNFIMLSTFEIFNLFCFHFIQSFDVFKHYCFYLWPTYIFRIYWVPRMCLQSEHTHGQRGRPLHMHQRWLRCERGHLAYAGLDAYCLLSYCGLENMKMNQKIKVA